MTVPITHSASSDDEAPPTPRMVKVPTTTSTQSPSEDDSDQHSPSLLPLQ
ncbi:hypothetical protein SCLCIDRAFT_26789 [Scleroderma citrinum Foug A]|uniref:Uncharacterized protein n=1 Tax=Scleroderma citrinum Foug A TaxID=1036808 RepID=A0A0C3DW83_9AGAM|nr:hypothetical protein SCLCIDRAFT_26789 [Scleroderma citrinum Foug A]